jgi:hypothetical protein
MKRCVLALMVVAASGLTACGSSSTSTGGAGDEASKSADQITADAIAALKQVKVAHVHGTVTSGGENSTAEGIVEPTSSSLTISGGASGTVTIIVTGGKAYGIQGSQAAELSGDFATQVMSFTLTRIAECAAAEHGKLSKGDPTTINGHRVIPIIDDGAAPGATAGTTFVALDGPPLVIRQVTTTATTPGGSLHCGHEQPSSTTTTSTGATGQTIDWDYPTDVPVITPPAGAASA